MSSIWFVLSARDVEPVDGFDEASAREIAARRDGEDPCCAPHRAVRYDPADPERDLEDAKALHHVLFMLRSYPGTVGPDERQAVEHLYSMLNGLKGSAS